MEYILIIMEKFTQVQELLKKIIFKAFENKK